MPMTAEQMDRTPTEKPPPGVIPNFVNPETDGPEMMATMWTLLGLAVLIVAMRLYSRGVILKKIGWDDWTALFAVVRSRQTQMSHMYPTESYRFYLPRA